MWVSILTSWMALGTAVSNNKEMLEKVYKGRGIDRVICNWIVGISMTLLLASIGNFFTAGLYLLGMSFQEGAQKEWDEIKDDND